MIKRTFPLLLRVPWLAALVAIAVGLALQPELAAAQSPQGFLDLEISHSVELAALRKVEPALLQSLLDDPAQHHRFLITMQEESKLPENESLAGMDRLARRRMVVQGLQDTAERSQSEIIRFLSEKQNSGEIQAVQSFWIFNGLAVTGPAETVLTLAQREDVKAIQADHVHSLSQWPIVPEGLKAKVGAAAAEWNIEKIRADQAWDALNIRGSGIVVANMDTGVDWQHPALYANYRGNLGKGIFDHRSSWFCATDEGYSEPTDVDGHGTHTMGTMVGHSADHAAVGVAPGAKWIAVKIFDNQNLTYDSWIHAGFQWTLDPGGANDPSLVPDIVNNSWGSSFGYDTRFQPDVQVLRAAGVAPVFSAGNEGPYDGTVGSPGSFPESIAVGATNSYDYISFFSSRGPSYWGTKPDLSAPGVDVVSSIPGGQYGRSSGTSMAAPHVAGTSALVLQANPALSVDALEDILASTALPRSAPIPNNEYGWGRVDAYQAAATAGQTGYLQGTVKRSTDNAPVAHATILAQAFSPSRGSGQTNTDAAGRYELPLAPWMYEFSVSAFGYQTLNISYVAIVTGTTQTKNFALTPLPAGQLSGRVVDLDTGDPFPATIVISGTTITAMADPETGYYRADIPAGKYDVQVRGSGHRIGWAYDVSVPANEGTQRDFALSQAPTILLVDSGAWYQSSQATYFQQALDDLDYLYDRRTIYQIYGSERSVPTAAELAPYDIVIWSCPDDSPGYAGAWEALAAYLDSGGKLFITGQNIGYWDHPAGWFPSPQYGQYLETVYVQDDSGSESLTGASAGLLEGLNLVLNGGDGAHNQDSPDEIRVLNEAKAGVLASYDDDGAGAQETGTCLPYQAIYFSFGFEGINQRETRREVMDRVIEAFKSSPSPVSNYVRPGMQSGIKPSGQTISYTLQVHNLNPTGLSDTYHLSIGGNAWPSTVTSDTVTVAACDAVTITAEVQIPAGVGWNATDVLSITARSSISPTVQFTAIISTNTPAPILLVDDDRWYDMEAYYESALRQNNLPYDSWRVGWRDGEQQGSPPTQTLQMYPIIIWFTGYDWANPLSEKDEQNLASSLSAGSSLLLSSQDYLPVGDVTPFAENYLGVQSYVPVTTTQITGIKDHPVTNLIPEYALQCAHGNRSGEATPVSSSDAAFQGFQGGTVGLTHAGPNFRTALFTFLYEGIVPEEGRRDIMRQMTGWLSWLGGSTFEADAAASPGSTITCTLTLRNDGWGPIAASATNDMPAQLSLVIGSLSPPEASYDAGTHRITWSRSLAVGEQVQMRYRAVISSTISAAVPITNIVRIGYAEHQIAFDLARITDIDAPNLGESFLSADRTEVDPGETLTYTINIRNSGQSAAASAILSDPIPVHTAYVTGSLQHQGSGSSSYENGVVTWDGELNVGEGVTLTYQAEVTTTQRGVWIRNRAYLWDHYNPMWRLEADTLVAPSKMWFPTVLKNSGG